LEIWSLTFLEYNTLSDRGFTCRSRISRVAGLLPRTPSRGTRLPCKQIAHWLRVHLGGRRHVDLELLKLQVQGLTEQQWLAAVREAPTRRQRWNSWGDFRQRWDDPENLADTHVDASEVVYLRELLSILEKNLMSEEVPYFRAIVERTPPKELAGVLGANPNTAWRRMKQVRMKVQDILKALGGPVSS
jgi:hypothetical protein